MDNLSKCVRNAEVVSAALGSWPSLHDAEILSVELNRAKPITAKLTVKTIPYDASGKTAQSLLVLLFKEIDELELFDFNEQNAIWDLTVEHDKERRKLVISSSYGLAGGFYFTEAEVLHVERLD